MTDCKLEPIAWFYCETCKQALCDLCAQCHCVEICEQAVQECEEAEE